MEEKNIYVYKNQSNMEIETFSAIWDEQKKIVVLYDGITDGFYSLDCETGKLHIMALLCGEKKQWGHFASPIQIKEGYCFPPCNREGMVIINHEGVIKEIPVKFDKEKDWRISNALEYKGGIIMLCAKANGIISVEMGKGKERIFDEWLKEYRARADDKDIYKCGKTRYGSYLLENNILTVPLLWISSILQLNLETGKYSFLDMCDMQHLHGFLTIYSVNGYKLLLSKENNQIVEMDQDGRTKVYSCELHGDTFGRSVLIGNKILILGMHTYQILVYDIITKDAQTYEITIAGSTGGTVRVANFSVMLTISETHILVFDVSIRSFLDIRTDDGWNSIYIKDMPLFGDEETQIRLFKKGGERQKSLLESKDRGLKFYIDVIQKM